MEYVAKFNINEHPKLLNLIDENLKPTGEKKVERIYL